MDHKHHEHVKQHKQEEHHDHHRMMMGDFRKRFWVSLLVTVPILFLSPLIADVFNYETLVDFTGRNLLLWALSSALFVYGGKPFLVGIRDELKSKNPGMMTLIAIAISVAYLYSTAVVFGLEGKLFFWELATLIDVMLLGHWMEMRSIIGASKALEELTKLLPANAHKIIKGQKTEDIAINLLKVGDKVLVKPGEKIPVDGMVLEGKSSVNEAILTGEAKLVDKNVNDAVIGGSINTDGVLVVQISKIGEETYINQVIKLVKEAQNSQSKTQDLAGRAARWLTVVGVGGGLLTLAVWALVSDQGFAFAMERAVTVMVITCPHALGLAIPLVISVSTAQSAKEGLLIRDRVAFERTKDIDVVVFDKTGTLTLGTFGVDKVVVKQGYKKGEVQKLAASLEANSQHPIAQAIADLSKDNYKVTNFKSLPGEGVEGVINNQKVQIVSPGYIDRNGMDSRQAAIEGLDSGSNTVVLLLIDNKVAAAISLSDALRENAQETIDELKTMGIKTYMLTGDSRQAASNIADKLGIDDYFAEMLPNQKSEKIKELQDQGLSVAMVGDGVNDAPALALADVGIAIGAGTDVAVETADLILVKSDPKNVVTAIRYAKATYRKMQQNLLWATGYNIIAIPLAAGVLYGAGVLISPAIGGVFMSLSTIIVAVNAKLLNVKK